MASVTQRVPYNTKVMRWARERRRVDRSEAARSASVRPEQIEDWEEGRSAPTVRQARLLASFYDRPFLEFFSSSIPELPPLDLVPDYRFQSQGPGDAELAALEAVQEWAETQRLNALDLYEMTGEAVPDFPREMQSSVEEDPEEAASGARRYLKFPIETQFRIKAKDRYRFPTTLRKMIESVGVLVLKQSDLPRTRTRGICLFHPKLPVIVFGNETSGGQAFTLIHEFAHVLLGKSAISGNPVIAYRHGSDQRKIEGWCNAFAAAFLMPSEAVKTHRSAPKAFVETFSDLCLNDLANSFAVSRHAMLIRLVTLNLVDPRFYWRKKRAEFILQEAEAVGGGRSEYYGSRYRNSLGDLYTGLVIEALETGRLGAHSASEFMGIKNVQHLIDIKANFGT
jgi:Zn-dependent peptidase ImmA (M78 family)/DNA-binding XRE family transcriptional regulator